MGNTETESKTRGRPAIGRPDSTVPALTAAGSEAPAARIPLCSDAFRFAGAAL